MNAPTKAELVAKYPGASIPFIDAFLRSGKSMRHFMAMREAWQAGIFHAIQEARNVPGSEMLKWQLNKDA